MPLTPSTRWCPTPEQLMILEEMYRSGIRTPNASQIQQITAHLSFYGKIEGKNVFYWFQNHKARDRQKLRRRLGGGRNQQLLPDQTDQPSDGASASSLHLQRSSNYAVNEEAADHHPGLNLVEKLEAAGEAGQLQEEKTAARSVRNSVMEYYHSTGGHGYQWRRPAAAVPAGMMAFRVDGGSAASDDHGYISDDVRPSCSGGSALKTLDLFPIKSTGFKHEHFCSSSKSSSPPPDQEPRPTTTDRS